MTQNLSRRQFITRVAAASSIGFPYLARAQNVNSALQVGFVAVGGQARTHTKAAHEAGLKCIAFADIDRNTWGGLLEKEGWQGAAGYTDWRKLFENHHQDLDVVFVATPDHSHYAPSMTAVSLGIHCYTEKPLSWSVREAQMLSKAYQANPKVVTQMGNQGHAGRGWRMAYEFVKGGAVGDVVEFHTWTNRPVWPQGGDRPAGGGAAPDSLDWESWIGPAPMRPYVPEVYHPFTWRGFVDFGSGALGDMACHTTDGIYAIMDCGYAETAEPIFMTSPVTDMYPAGMTVKMTYRATADRPGFTTYWYEGKRRDGTPNRPDTPEELTGEGREMPETGNLIVGTRGKMLVIGDYWESPRLIPESAMRAFGRPERLLERSPGHHAEFFAACRGEKPRAFSQSNFGYAGPMTANIQLGNLCARAGKKLVLNETGRIVNDPDVDRLAWREPRKGWGALKTKV